ncbi:MAG: alpha/beta fold hydrolase, partial [Alphaproteobacteria bacterium]|nr:alpha/beta fold hydrolase [Alphaproteobacteria bacterium]
MILESRTEPKRNARRRRGFSLTELAIVLCVAGMIVGGIWAAASYVTERVRRSQAADQVMIVVGNIRSLSQGRANISGSFDALTNSLINNGAIPNDMILNHAAAPPLRANHPWGAVGVDGTALAAGGFAVGGNSVADPTLQTFIVEFRGLNLGACMDLAARVSGTSGPSGLTGVTINGTAMTLPVLPISTTLADPNGAFVQAGDTRMYYQKMENGDVPIVLVHGFGASSFSWRENLDPIADAGFTVYAPDMRGFGLSDKGWDKSMSQDAQADRLKAFMDAQGIDRAVLAGNSMGGGIV